VECEFCGRRHNIRDDICDIQTNEENSGNSLSKGAYDIRLIDLYSMIKYKRDLVFEVMIHEE